MSESGDTTGRTPAEIGGGGARAPRRENKEGLDPANAALAEALRISFVVLKILIICIIVLFIWSGVYRVEQNEWAVELRFGKVKGFGEKAIDKQAGLKWKWPAPIEEVIKIHDPETRKTLDVKAFWYYEDPRMMAGGRVLPSLTTLQYGKDGYSLTGSQSAARMLGEGIAVEVSAAAEQERGITDYSIVHTQWRLRYAIADPIVLIEQLWDGTTGREAGRGWQVVEGFLRDVVSDAVIKVSARTDIEEIVWTKADMFKNDVRQLVRERMGALGVGLKIEDLDLIGKSPARQVQTAFEQASQARSNRNKLITDALGRREEIINEARAQASIIEARARGYSTKVEQASKADADYLKEVLRKIDEAVRERVPEGTEDSARKRAQVHKELLAVTVDQLYQETLRKVIDSAEEVFVHGSDKAAPTELRLILNRDPTLRRRGAAGREQKKEPGRASGR